MPACTQTKSFNFTLLLLYLKAEKFFYMRWASNLISLSILSLIFENLGSKEIINDKGHSFKKCHKQGRKRVYQGFKPFWLHYSYINVMQCRIFN